jgi:hypothetical protein
MTNIQLLISVGLPMLVLAAGMWMNSNAVNHLRTDMNARFILMDNRFNALGDSLDRLVGICNDLDKRISIIEDRMHLR